MQLPTAVAAFIPYGKWKGVVLFVNKHTPTVRVFENLRAGFTPHGGSDVIPYYVSTLPSLSFAPHHQSSREKVNSDIGRSESGLLHMGK